MDISETDMEELFIIIDKAKMDIVTLSAQCGEGYYSPKTYPREYFKKADSILNRIVRKHNQNRLEE